MHNSLVNITTFGLFIVLLHKRDESKVDETNFITCSPSSPSLRTRCATTLNLNHELQTQHALGICSYTDFGRNVHGAGSFLYQAELVG